MLIKYFHLPREYPHHENTLDNEAHRIFILFFLNYTVINMLRNTQRSGNRLASQLHPEQQTKQWS